MTSKVAVTCFTDIEDSASLTERLGHTVFGELRRKYFTVCESLAARNGVSSPKNTGDGHMLTFDDIESSLKFASQLQSYYQQQPNYYVESIFKFRIGMYSGVIDQETHDSFGSGVNRASRVESKTPVGQVWVNEDLFKQISLIWGDDKTTALFQDLGEVEVKKLPPMRLYSFDWRTYTRNYPNDNLPSLVCKQLEDASVIMWNLTLAEVSSQLPVIWPVVPREGINAIHCGQLAIIRLLAMLGSPITVLIANCGATNNPTREYSENFRKQVDIFANKLGIRNIKYNFMTDIFEPGCASCQDFHRHFQNVISQMKFSELLAANNKEYSEDVKEAIKQAPTLDFLKPALTISSILHLSEKEQRKCIIVVGYDEKIQWQGAQDSIQNTTRRFGVMYNPILKTKTGAQMRQTNRVTRYRSWQQIVEDMEKYDLIDWLVKIQLYLSLFPATSVTIDGNTVSPSNWLKGDIEGKIDKVALAKKVFNEFLSQ